MGVVGVASGSSACTHTCRVCREIPDFRRSLDGLPPELRRVRLAGHDRGSSRFPAVAGFSVSKIKGQGPQKQKLLQVVDGANRDLATGPQEALSSEQEAKLREVFAEDEAHTPAG